MNVAARFSGKGQPYEGLAKFSSVKRLPQWTGKVRLVPEHLADPLRWTKPRRIFVNSMSDLFHEKLTNKEIAAVFGVMSAAPMHTFQILTKRARRMREWFEWMHSDPIAKLASAMHAWQMKGFVPSAAIRPALYNRQPDGNVPYWPLPWVWLGVSAEDQERADERVPELLRTPAAVRFVSYEPALGPIDFTRLHGEMSPSGALAHDSLTGVYGGGPWKTATKLDWVICGAESGPRHRPFSEDWARSVRDQCVARGVAFFYKQNVDARGHKIGTPPLDGKRWEQFPREVST